MSEIYYSDNDYEYLHDDLEECIYSVIENCHDLELGYIFSVWKGECNMRKASGYAPDVLEDMGNQACDEISEFAGDWPDVTKEQGTELKEAVNKVIDDWADKYNQQPNFGLMSNCKEIFYRVTKMAEDASDVEYVETTIPKCTECNDTGQILQDDGSDSMGTLIPCELCKAQLTKR